MEACGGVWRACGGGWRRVVEGVAVVINDDYLPSCVLSSQTSGGGGDAECLSVCLSIVAPPTLHERYVNVLHTLW